MLFWCSEGRGFCFLARGVRRGKKQIMQYADVVLLLVQQVFQCENDMSGNFLANVACMRYVKLHQANQTVTDWHLCTFLVPNASSALGFQYVGLMQVELQKCTFGCTPSTQKGLPGQQA